MEDLRVIWMMGLFEVGFVGSFRFDLDVSFPFTGHGATSALDGRFFWFPECEDVSGG